MNNKNFALITGASSGIGLAISAELAKRGHHLLMVSIEGEKLAQEARNLEKIFNIKTFTLCMNLAEEDSAQKLFDYCKSNSIIIDILVNNAGIFFFKDVTDTSSDKIKTMINLHIITPSALCQLFAGQMIEDNRKGFILNMASVSSRMMMPGIAFYSSTKSFIRCFSRCMRNEVFDKGVSVTAISPGAVATGLYNLPSRYLKLGIKLGVIMKPERLAALAVKKMFKRRKEFIPAAFINTLFILIVNILPEKFVRKIKRKINARLKKT